MNAIAFRIFLSYLSLFPVIWSHILLHLYHRLSLHSTSVYARLPWIGASQWHKSKDIPQKCYLCKPIRPCSLALSASEKCSVFPGPRVSLEPFIHYNTSYSRASISQFVQCALQFVRREGIRLSLFPTSFRCPAIHTIQVGLWCGCDHITHGGTITPADYTTFADVAQVYRRSDVRKSTQCSVGESG